MILEEEIDSGEKITNNKLFNLTDLSFGEIFGLLKN